MNVVLLCATPALLAPSHAPFRIGACRPALRPLMAEGGGDEIADLEARLAQLKAAEAAKQAEEAAAARAAAASAEPDVGGFDFATLSSRKKVAAVKSRAPDEFLSESWKEDDAEASGGGGGLPVVQLAGGVLAALALLAFSQVPIGQNLDEATYNNAESKAPVESPAQIKARYERAAAGLGEED